MTDELPDDVQRWTAKRRAALVVSIMGSRKPNGETERVPVGAVVEMQAEHVRHHVMRIRAIRSEIGGL